MHVLQFLLLLRTAFVSNPPADSTTMVWTLCIHIATVQLEHTTTCFWHGKKYAPEHMLSTIFRSFWILKTVFHMVDFHVFYAVYSAFYANERANIVFLKHTFLVSCSWPRTGGSNPVWTFCRDIDTVQLEHTTTCPWRGQKMCSRIHAKHDFRSCWVPKMVFHIPRFYALYPVHSAFRANKGADIVI